MRKTSRASAHMCGTVRSNAMQGLFSLKAAALTLQQDTLYTAKGLPGKPRKSLYFFSLQQNRSVRTDDPVKTGVLPPEVTFLHLFPLLHRSPEFQYRKLFGMSQAAQYRCFRKCCADRALCRHAAGKIWLRRRKKLCQHRNSGKNRKFSVLHCPLCHYITFFHMKRKSRKKLHREVQPGKNAHILRNSHIKIIQRDIRPERNI